MFKIKLSKKVSGKKTYFQIEVIDDNDITVELKTAKTIRERGILINQLKEFYNVDDVINPDLKRTRGRVAKAKILPTPVVPFTSSIELDDYFEANKSLFWDRVIEAINEGLIHKKSKIELFILGDTGQKLSSRKDEWLNGVQQAKDFFEEGGAFEKCKKCVALIAALTKQEE